MTKIVSGGSPNWFPVLANFKRNSNDSLLTAANCDNDNAFRYLLYGVLPRYAVYILLWRKWKENRSTAKSCGHETGSSSGRCYSTYLFVHSCEIGALMTWWRSSAGRKCQLVNLIKLHVLLKDGPTIHSSTHTHFRVAMFLRQCNSDNQSWYKPRNNIVSYKFLWIRTTWLHLVECSLLRAV